MTIRDTLSLAAVCAASVAVLGMGDCGTTAESPTSPPPTTQPAAPPTQQQPTGGPVAIHTTPADANHGLKVEIIHDEWNQAHGPSCHSEGGKRTFRLTNEGTVERYSNLSAFTDDVPRCGTDKRPTGVPRWETTCTIGNNGKPHIKPGETCEYTVFVEMPSGKDEDCTLQVDDTWGPGGYREGAFVIGDSWKVPDSKCKKVCIENPEPIHEKGCGDWSECKLVSDGEWRGRFCVTYLSNSGSDYRIEDDGAIWKNNLTLSSGNQNTCWNRSNLDGSNLCLWWKGEKIDCARASCGDVEESWHGTVKFRCNRDPVCEQEQPCWETEGIDYKCKADESNTRRWTKTRPCECPGD
jgi:hypothetical protein